MNARRFFAVCAPGLEPFVAAELHGLGLLDSPFARVSKGSPGTLEFEGSSADAYRANLWLRTADRVLVKLGEFRARAFPELRRKAALLPWEKFLSPGRPVAFRVDSRRSRLYHETGAAERLAGAVSDRLGAPSSLVRGAQDGPKEPAALFFVDLEDDLCSIRADSSGAPLHKRGYRLASAKAPLRETLACAMVMASGWDETSPLLDPFCGSGTIPIEAALLAAKAAPGRARRFAFMDWPGFDSGIWAGLLEDAAKRRAAEASAFPRIIASDRDEGAVKAARENAQRAGVADRIELSCRAFSAIEPPRAPGWVVTNPPYGVRLKGSGDLRDLYAGLGRVLVEKCRGWRAALLCGSGAPLRSTGLRFDEGLGTMNGGLGVRLSIAEI